jgi:hypothetical protein
VAGQGRTASRLANRVGTKAALDLNLCMLNIQCYS